MGEELDELPLVLDIVSQGVRVTDGTGRGSHIP